MKLSKEQIAKVCQDVNKAYCEALGDTSQTTWENAPQWQKESILMGVTLHTNNPNAGPDDSHNSWLLQKADEGWKYGPVKNVELKEHPCFVSYENLPKEQQAKDFIFRAVVHSLNNLIDNSNVLSKDEIREIFLSNGFRIKEGETDLLQYVYSAAQKLIERSIAIKQELPLTVTEEYIDKLCGDPEKAHYTLFPETLHTVCCIKLPNGATMIGESVTPSSKVFNEALGREYAFKDARKKVFQFEGYALCEKRYQAGLEK